MELQVEVERVCVVLVVVVGFCISLVTGLFENPPSKVFRGCCGLSRSEEVSERLRGDLKNG
jgi:Mn2+/Fe2+ NRAMP family transporter